MNNESKHKLQTSHIVAVSSSFPATDTTNTITCFVSLSFTAQRITTILLMRASPVLVTTKQVGVSVTFGKYSVRIPPDYQLSSLTFFMAFLSLSN